MILIIYILSVITCSCDCYMNFSNVDGILIWVSVYKSMKWVHINRKNNLDHYFPAKKLKLNTSFTYYGGHMQISMHPDIPHLVQTLHYLPCAICVFPRMDRSTVSNLYRMSAHRIGISLKLFSEDTLNLLR